ncbi:Glycosyl transferase family 2 [Poseidonocella sedimentorum]|uniref:Glycosyl transferase family 2 n=2 Tax=Poseidonocella sedimentorum TaxID=871652 RepID=A0A1I6D485_9RHOB|nr:Glycosyl transferase family 2 [Poseidonocella sedimentorum]
MRKSSELEAVHIRTSRIRDEDILCCATLRNELDRLPYFLKYYRELGIGHFLIVDNGSDDGSTEYLAQQADVSLWSTGASYKAARFGMDWMNRLLSRYGHNHWTLTVDPDEFFVYPFCDSRDLRALTHWLDASSIRSFSAMLLDLYPRAAVGETRYVPGQDPVAATGWFDAGNYTIKRNELYGNLWIQGGVRARTLFTEDPYRAPALNKIPLVKWHRRNVYVSSTHSLLPRGLNRVYDEWGGEKASGVLLHTKFLDVFETKAREEIDRQQHYADGFEYRAYADRLRQRPSFWCDMSERYSGWQQLDSLGLMSRGNWA